MTAIEDGRALAQAMVDTVRDALLVLDGNLQVITASRSFYATFQTSAEQTEGRMIYDLGSGEWNNPALRDLLDRIVPEHGVMDHFEVEQDFPHIGRRIMLLNARLGRCQPRVAPDPCQVERARPSLLQNKNDRLIVENRWGRELQCQVTHEMLTWSQTAKS